MKKLLLIILGLSFYLYPIKSFAHKTDSVGVKVKDGKIFIIHEVQKGEGLYGISKKYNVSLSDLLIENPGSDAVIKVGQKVIIPTYRNASGDEKDAISDYYRKSQKEQPSKSEKIPDEVSTFATKHTVEKGQTLFSISKKYETTVKEIIALNNMKTNDLKEGQVLLIPSKKSTIVILDSEPEDKIANKEEDEKTVEKETVVTEKSNSAGYSLRTEKLPEYNLEKVEEKGKVIIGDKNIPVDKYVGLHHEAAEGTVIMVTNPENGQTVFVKIVGNFTKSEKDADVIKISNASAERLGLTKSGTFITLSYAR